MVSQAVDTRFKIFRLFLVRQMMNDVICWPHDKWLIVLYAKTWQTIALFFTIMDLNYVDNQWTVKNKVDENQSSWTSPLETAELILRIFRLPLWWLTVAVESSVFACYWKANLCFLSPCNMLNGRLFDWGHTFVVWPTVAACAIGWSANWLRYYWKSIIGLPQFFNAKNF